MSVEVIHLRKLLQLFYAENSLRTSLLRADIRDEVARENGYQSEGGDFFTPFWSDAKHHVAGSLDLTEQTAVRIGSNWRRHRLYQMMSDAFLVWWNERRRWRNEPFEFVPQSVRARYPAQQLGVVKVENLLALRILEGEHRIFYPYFSEAPSLSEEAARVGLWVLREALPQYETSELRVLDILRQRSFSIEDVPLLGNEEDVFRRNYSALIAQRALLREEY